MSCLLKICFLRLLSAAHRFLLRGNGNSICGMLFIKSKGKEYKTNFQKGAQTACLLCNRMQTHREQSGFCL